MKTPQQALHIFKKDVRHLRWEIAAVLCLAAFLVWLWTDSWTGEANGDLVRTRPRELAGPYVAGIWFLFIARLLHAEPLVGDRPFWLTRPYSRTALLLAKGFFAAAFLLLPLLIAQVLAVLLSGLRVSLGTLLLNQLAIAAIVLFPAAAVAAMTRSLWQYVPLVSAGGFAAAALWGETSLSAPVPHVVGAILLGTFSLGVLLVQLRGRRTLRNAAVYVVACVAVWLLVAAFPRDLARAAESALDEGSARDLLTFGIAASPRPGDIIEPPFPGLPRPPWRLRPQIRLPITVTGANFRDLALMNPTVTLRTAAGETYQLAAILSRDESGHSLVTSSVILRDAFFGFRLLGTMPTPIMNEPVSLHVELWVKRFRDAATATLPTDGSAVMLDGREQCRAIRPGSRRLALQPDSPPAVMCRHSLFASPWREHGVRREPYPELDARSTLPSIDPIRQVQLQFFGFPLGLNGAEVTVVLRERVGFFRAAFEAENVRLAEFVVP